jgi:hypothetical protein
MRILSKLLAFAVVLVALWAPANAAPTITVNLTNASATGSENLGQCPQTFNFTGTIDARMARGFGQNRGISV